jgi:hypothetical protein
VRGRCSRTRLDRSQRLRAQFWSEDHVNIDVSGFRAKGYTVVHSAIPAVLCEALVQAIGDVSGLVADRPGTWYRDPPLPWDIVPMWGHQAQWDIRQHPALHEVWSALWDTTALLVTLDRCRFSIPTLDPGRGGAEGDAGRCRRFPLRTNALPRPWRLDARAHHGGRRALLVNFDRRL